MSQGFKLLENFDNYQFEYLQKLKANIRNFEQIAMVISLFLNKIMPITLRRKTIFNLKDMSH